MIDLTITVCRLSLQPQSYIRFPWELQRAAISAFKGQKEKGVEEAATQAK